MDLARWAVDWPHASLVSLGGVTRVSRMDSPSTARGRLFFFRFTRAYSGLVYAHRRAPRRALRSKMAAGKKGMAALAGTRPTHLYPPLLGRRSRLFQQAAE